MEQRIIFKLLLFLYKFVNSSLIPQYLTILLTPYAPTKSQNDWRTDNLTIDDCLTVTIDGSKCTNY